MHKLLLALVMLHALWALGRLGTARHKRVPQTLVWLGCLEGGQLEAFLDSNVLKVAHSVPVRQGLPYGLCCATTTGGVGEGDE